MKSAQPGGVHRSFWVIGGIALIWNALGAVNFIAQMSADTVASMPEAYRIVIGDRPAWATGAFAIAVFGGTLGCVLLLLRRAAAFYLFLASLVGVIVTMAHALGENTPTVDFTPVFVGTSMSLVVAGFLMWYAKFAERTGWIESTAG